MPSMRRREFVSLFSGAAATWPLAVRAQQSAVPVVGLITGFSAEGRRALCGRVPQRPQPNRATSKART